MLTIGVVLRNEPQLRSDLMTAGMDAIAAVAGSNEAAIEAPEPQDRDRQLTDRVKVNRPATPPVENSSSAPAASASNS